MTNSAVSLGHPPSTRWVQHEVYRRVIGGEQWMLACTDGLSSLVSAWSPAARDAHLPVILADRTSFAHLDPGFLIGGRVSADALRSLSILKTWCDEARYRAADTANGGSGLLAETGIEQIFRAAHNLRIPAGTTEIPRELIARSP